MPGGRRVNADTLNSNPSGPIESNRSARCTPETVPETNYASLTGVKKTMNVLRSTIARRQAGKPNRHAFTLVELLVVIAVIGVLVGLAIPAIARARRTAIASAMKAEVTNIENGINSYNTKYGDYPPDMMSWPIVRRHYLKIFPDIAQSELNLLFRLGDTLPDNDANQMSAISALTWNGAVLDRAEAVVWNLGGFSSDPQYPFTGSGGPLLIVDPAVSRENPLNVEYNPSRVAPIVEFEASRLSLVAKDPSVVGSRYLSLDDDLLGNDVFPTYVLREGQSPIVYFDSRTYRFNAGDESNGSYLFNAYARTTSDTPSGFDAIRPVVSINPGKNAPSGTYDTAASALTAWLFENPRTFQVLAPGLDGLYGGVSDSDLGADASNAPPVYWQSSGQLVDTGLAGSVSTPAELLARTPGGALIQRFDVTGLSGFGVSGNPFQDNICNFVSGTFIDSIE